MSVDLKGQRFGRLTVVERADDYVYPSSHKHAARWKCLCDCGKYKIIRESSLKSGNTTSCGCYRNDQATVANKIHNKKFNRYIEKDDYIIGYDINNKEFYCDKDDFEKIRNMSWHFDDKGYVVSSVQNSANIKMHRFITNCPDDMQVDHKNGCKNDNRKSNLRICTPSQNSMNKKTNNIYGMSGIYREYNKWYAVIGKDREKFFLGSYDTEYEAKLARKNAENILFKEFSYSNSRGEQIDD